MVTDAIIGLTDDTGFDCDAKPIKGIEQRILLLNWLDIDRGQTKWNARKTRITQLYLKNNRTGYMATGYKSLFNGGSKVKGNGFEHGVSVKFFHMDDDNVHQLNQAVKSGLYIAVVEVKAKGLQQQDAFEVVGYDYGLQATEGGRNYNESDGVFSLSFSTPSHLTEPRSVYKWLEKDYANTLARFDSKLSEGVEDEFKIFDTFFNDVFA